MYTHFFIHFLVLPLLSLQFATPSFAKDSQENKQKDIRSAKKQEKDEKPKKNQTSESVKEEPKGEKQGTAAQKGAGGEKSRARKSSAVEENPSSRDPLSYRDEDVRQAGIHLQRLHQTLGHMPTDDQMVEELKKKMKISDALARKIVEDQY